MSAQTVILPWPSKSLSPNARVHWAVAAKSKKAHRNAAYMLAKKAGIKLAPDARPLVSLTFVPPDRRPRDRDNMLASCKSLLDGLADAMGCDDARWRLAIEVSPDIGGFVRVVVSA